MNKQTIVGVLGAGSMGAGIAQIAATQEHKVVLVDLSQDVLDNSKTKLVKILARLVEKEKIDLET
jgi:3-hydroxybutyryl-CoA dehydrogenase